MLSDWLLPIYLVVQLAGLVAAADAVMTGRTAQGAIAWVIALVLVPPISVPMYLVFGSRRFSGYVRARRKGYLGINRLAREVHDRLKPFAVPTALGPAAFERLTLLPATLGNHTRLLIDGEQTFEAIFQAIERAQRYILVQFYIIRDDNIGRRLKDALIAACKRGVKVHILYDQVGSSSLPRAFVNALTCEKAEAYSFRTTRLLRTRFQINFRNHRKIVVVDGREAFLGGLNVGDEYLGHHPVYTPWRDTHVAIQGPAVQAVQLAFVEDWYWITDKVPDLEWTPQTVPDTLPAQHALVVPSGAADELESCALLYTHLINSARQRLWIATPYFVPDEGITTALQLAALRGVDVRIIIPERDDNRLAWFAAFSYYPEVLPAGAKIYRFQKGFMHQKVLLSDDTAAVGTANLDNRSLRINFEITHVVPDARFAQQTAEMLQRDLERCTGVSLNDFNRKPWWFRLAVRAARLLAPIL